MAEFFTIRCRTDTRARVERLLGAPTGVVEIGDTELGLRFRLTAPAENAADLKKIKDVRQYIARITGGPLNGRLDPKRCRPLPCNSGVPVDLDRTWQILWPAMLTEALSAYGGETVELKQPDRPALEPNGGGFFTTVAGEPDLAPEPAPEPNDGCVAAEFLQKLRPGGPWIPTAIVPDGDTTTITAHTVGEVETFVHQHDGQQNLYYSPNPTRTPLRKKAKKTDIAAIEYLHFDGDPRDDETPEAAKARYLNTIKQSGLKFAFVVDSGNGIQGLIRLTERIELGPLVDGKLSPEDQAKVDDVEARIKALTLRLGGDIGTQNIDRILRLPGTTNLPNATKLKKGRTECQAKLLWFDDASYPLDAFPLHKENGGHFGGLGGSGSLANIDWNKVKQPGWLKSVADLPSDIPDKIRRIIGHTGTLKDLNDDLIEDGQLNKRYTSWSEVTFALAASLKSYGKYTLEEIAEALLADLPCNQHIVEQKHQQRAVERAITRSHDPKALAIAGVTFRDCDRYGRPKPSLANAVRAIRALGIDACHDLFHHRINISYKGEAKTICEGLLTDDMTSAVRSLINNTYRIDCGDNLTLAAIKEVARDNAFDPVLDMLDDFQAGWDGTRRLDSWVIGYLGCEDTPLNRAIGWLWLVAACRRARSPGCKFDQIIVLEGPEGINKSTAIRVLAGDDNFSDASIIGADAKEVQEQLDGVWMHENADLAGMRKAEVEKVKAFARRQVDRARPAYGRVREDRPRRSIETGTTNDDIYMLSQTGNRCFWPLKTSRIDIKTLIRDRAQLLGEAATYEAARISIVLDEKLWGAARIAQEQRRVTDPWEDILKIGMGTTVRKSNDGFERVASAEVLRIVLGVEYAHQTSAHGQRLAHAMKWLGWKRNPSGLVTIDGRPVRGFVRPSAASRRPIKTQP